MRGVVLVLGVALGLVLGACGDSQNDAVGICDRVCECQFDLPSQRDGCFAGCMEDIPPNLELPAECVECFEVASCVALDACLPACGVDDEPPVEGS